MTQHEWENYEVVGEDFIPMEQWSKDHWSTFAYCTARAIDHKGILSNCNMRVNARIHREFATNFRLSAICGDGSQYPTRLKEGTVDRHDDFSCVEDMVAAGLLTAEWRVVDSDELFGNSEARITFTEQGMLMSGQLQAHKMQGGTYATFNPCLPSPE